MIHPPQSVNELSPEMGILGLRSRHVLRTNAEQFNAKLFCQASIAEHHCGIRLKPGRAGDNCTPPGTRVDIYVRL